MAAMPSENILLIEKIYEGIVSRATELPWGGHFTGQQGAVTFFTGVLANVDSVVVTERLIDAGDDGKVKGFYAYIDHPTMMAAIR